MRRKFEVTDNKKEGWFLFCPPTGWKKGQKVNAHVCVYSCKKTLKCKAFFKDLPTIRISKREMKGVENGSQNGKAEG